MPIRVACLGVSDVISSGVKTLRLTLPRILPNQGIICLSALHIASKSPTIVSLQQQSSTFTTIMKI